MTGHTRRVSWLLRASCRETYNITDRVAEASLIWLLAPRNPMISGLFRTLCAGGGLFSLYQRQRLDRRGHHGNQHQAPRRIQCHDKRGHGWEDRSDPYKIRQPLRPEYGRYPYDGTKAQGRRGWGVFREGNGIRRKKTRYVTKIQIDEQDNQE